MSSDPFVYQGQELDIFAEARRWKAYWASRVEPWVRGHVLEVGAGTGGNTALLQNTKVQSWRCLEPDRGLVSKLTANVSGLSGCSVTCGTLSAVAGEQFDSILYVDVLEHIEADRRELALAASLLRTHGHLIVVAPAHQFLFSEFDAAIGHYRRYDRSSLMACSPENCRLDPVFYLDSIGMLASVANRLFLRQSQPTIEQIRAWDRYIVPVSRAIDPILGRRLGKTICGVWTRTE